MTPYRPRDFSSLRGLRDIPDALVEAHLALYEGYVTNVNLLDRRIAQAEPGSAERSGLHRRVGFELNGVRLHELYFENLVPGGEAPSRAARDLLAARWGSFAAWREEFSSMGLMRGVGWVILYEDPATGWLVNCWIELHQDGHPAGFTPLLVMDVWEHAFTGLERKAYVGAFLGNARWSAVESRRKGRWETSRRTRVRGAQEK